MADQHELFSAEWLFENCRIVFYPPNGMYPIEHNPHALGYDKDGSSFKRFVRHAIAGLPGNNEKGEEANPIRDVIKQVIAEGGLPDPAGVLASEAAPQISDKEQR